VVKAADDVARALARIEARTTFCMLAFQNGARPEELVQQTGHSLATLFGYYAQASPTQRRRAVNAMPKVEGAHLEAAS